MAPRPWRRTTGLESEVQEKSLMPVAEAVEAARREEARTVRKEGILLIVGFGCMPGTEGDG